MAKESKKPAANPLDDLLDEYNDKLIVDKHDLDSEFEKQPQLFREVSDNFALAVSERDGRKDEMKQKAAELALEHREDGDKRRTDKEVEALVASDEQYVKACRRYNRACLRAQQWENLKEAFKERGYALKMLAELYIAGYYGENSHRSSAARDISDIEDRKNRDIIKQSRKNRK